MRVPVDGVEPAGTPVHLTFDGHPVTAELGDSLAAALVDSGHRGYRVAGADDERGVFCGMGVCHECAVVVDGHSGQLACMTAVRPGARVDKQPPAPALSAVVASEQPERRLEPDVLILGGGPAGLAAAATAARAGLEVLVVDERSKLGGQYFKQPAAGTTIDEARLDSQYAEGRKLIDAAIDAGVQTLLEVQVWGAVSPTHLLAVGRDERYAIHPRRLILGPGAYERGVPIPGWTLPGVMTTGAAQTLLRAHRVSPGSSVLVSGNGPLNLQLAADLAAGGVNVVALAEAADVRWWSGLGSGAAMAAAGPATVARGLGYRATLIRKRVPVLSRSAVVSVEGDDAAERAIVARLDSTGGVVPGTQRTFAVDAVCMGFGFLPSDEIPRTLGCKHVYDAGRGSLVVERTESGRTSVDGVWVVGDAGGVSGAEVALAAGVLAACDVIESLGIPVPRSIDRKGALRRHRRSARFQTHLWKLYRAPVFLDHLAGPDTIVCRCESVTLGELELGLDAGALEAGPLKRMTRAGMGKCQGRYCGPIVTALAARRSGVPVGEFSGFAPQPPFRPVEIGSLAEPPPTS